MIQKIAQINEEKKFEGMAKYGLLDEEKGVIQEYPNCLEEEVITDF